MDSRKGPAVSVDMSPVMMGVRRLATGAARPSKTTYKGCLFAALNNRGETVSRHPMDTNTDEYYRVVNDIVLPLSMEIAPDVAGYSERVKHLVTYTNPAFSDVWNFTTELAYLIVAPPEHLTEENLTKIRILRACMDLSWTMVAVLDDIVDGSDTRMNKPAWHKICEGGLPEAIYDSNVMCFLPFHILQHRFKGDPGYHTMVDIMLTSFMRVMIGQQIDVLGQGARLSEEWQRLTALYKVGHFVCIQQPFGLLHAGILDMRIIKQALAINSRFGIIFQYWDDFNDYYSSTTAKGKPCCDIPNGGTTWASVTALKHFTPAQAKLFKESYGSKDPEKVKTVMELYDEVNMPGLYIEEMRKQYREISALIAQVPHAKVRKSLTSHLDWFIVDVKD